MGGGKETPRQKMIGLMYLVLMALLAMNVSKEIINAFVTLNNKLESSIEQGTLILVIWTLDPTSSKASIALSGKCLSEIYLSVSSTHDFIASGV